MTKINLKNYVDAMLETSSVAAHDISGQVHVMQFCVEELGEYISKDGEKYLSRLQSSLDELTEITSFYRTYLKKSQLADSQISASSLLEKVLVSIKMNFWNELKKVSFKSNVSSENWKLNTSCAEVQSVIYSLIAIYLDELKKGKIGEPEVELSLIKLDSQYCQFTLVSDKSVDIQKFQNLDSCLSPGGKSLRKNLGHDVLLDSPLYEVSLESTESSFKILLNMKVLDE